MIASIKAVALALMLAASGASAAQCQPGRDYCGYHLRSLGYNEETLNSRTSNGDSSNALFLCSSQGIQLIEHCNQCMHTQESVTDYCGFD